MMGAVRITIRVRPGAARTRVGGRYGSGPDGALVVAVAERAVDGAATGAALAALARALGVPTRAVTLVAGQRSRTKIVDVDAGQAGGEEALRSALEALLAP